MDAFKWLTSIFQAVGILPISFQPKQRIARKRRQILELWSIGVILINVGLTVTVLHYRDTLMLIGAEVGTLNIFIKFITVFVAGYITLLESLCRCDHIKYFYDQLNGHCIDFESVGLKVKNRLAMDRKKCFFWFIFLKQITLSKSFLDFLIFKDESIHIVYYAFATIISYSICQIKCFQMCSTLVDMTNLVKELNNGLRLVINESVNLCGGTLKPPNLEKRYEKLTDAIIFLKLKHLDLKLLSYEINASFGWSVTFYFFQVFAITTSDLYWIYVVKIIKPDFNSNIKLVPAIMNQIALVLTVLVVVSAAEKYYNEADVSLALLHQIRRKKDEVRKSGLKNF